MAQSSMLVSTRVVRQPHLGTFYGWIRPILEHAEWTRIVVLLADYQSFDGERLAQPEENIEFQQTLRRFLPNTIDIVSESELYGITTILPLLMRVGSISDLGRNPTIRALQRGGDLRFGHLCYPLLMAADLLGIRPTSILSNATGFGYHEFPTKMAMRLFLQSGNAPTSLLVKHFPEIRLLNDDGQRIRRRGDDVPYLGLASDKENFTQLESWIATRSAPENGEDRWSRCIAPRSIWTALETHAAAPLCLSDARASCSSCKYTLAEIVRNDLKAAVRVASIRAENVTAGLSNFTENLRRINVSVVGGLHPAQISTEEADVIAFAPREYFLSEFVVWIASSFARMIHSRSQGRPTRFVMVIMPPKDLRARSSDAARISMMAARLVKISGNAGISCTVAFYHELKFDERKLMERLYLQRARPLLKDSISNLQYEIDLALVGALYGATKARHAIVFGEPARAFSDFTSGCAESDQKQNNEPVSGEDLIDPVSTRLDMGFGEMIRRYPTAPSFDQGEANSRRLALIAEMSESWLNNGEEIPTLDTRFEMIKSRIISIFAQTW